MKKNDLHSNTYRASFVCSGTETKSSKVVGQKGSIYYLAAFESPNLVSETPRRGRGSINYCDHKGAPRTFLENYIYISHPRVN